MANSPKLTVVLPDSVHAAVHQQAAMDGRSASDFVCRIIKKELGFPDTPKLNARTNPKLALQ